MSSISLLSPPLSPSRRPYVTGFRGQQTVGKVGQLALGFAQTGPSGHACTGHTPQATWSGATLPQWLPTLPTAIGVAVEPSPNSVKPFPSVDYLAPSLLDLVAYKTDPFPLCLVPKLPPFTSAITGELCSAADSPSPPLHCRSSIPCHLPRAPVKLLDRTTPPRPRRSQASLPTGILPLPRCRLRPCQIHPEPPKVRSDLLSLFHPLALTAGVEPHRNPAGTRRTPAARDSIARTKIFLGSSVKDSRGLTAK